MDSPAGDDPTRARDRDPGHATDADPEPDDGDLDPAATTDDPDVDANVDHADASGADGEAEDDGIDRRRLIRWLAVLAFGVPVVVEGVTFGRLFAERLLGDADGGIGVGDELLPETAATETVLTSDLRGDGGRTYVLRVAVDNGTDAPVELRLSGLRLADGSTVPGTSSTGPVPPGGRGEVTGAWSVGDGTPEAVEVTALRDGAVVRETTVALAL